VIAAVFVVTGLVQCVAAAEPPPSAKQPSAVAPHPNPLPKGEGTNRSKPAAREIRAVWNHSGAGAYPGDWERSAKLLADSGFTAVFPNMLWGGVAHYPSDVLPRSATFRKHGDQIAQCCAAAKRHGLEVHVWKVCYNLATAPNEFAARMRREGRLQVSNDGKPSLWLCPSNPENRKLETDSLIEIARKYPADGLQLDYIRYPDGSHCYCEGCRRRFETESGRKVAEWPGECFSGSRQQEYREWRCRQIAALVAMVSREARKVRPGIKISAAVFGAYPDCRKWVGQDWPEWIKAGDVDFVCPMDYTADDTEFAKLVRNGMTLVGGRVPVVVGIGARATGIKMTPEKVLGQVRQARSLGAAGFALFNLDGETAGSLIPALGADASRKQMKDER
jgi:uncharacterized lipoprotein YddW (UPF0748 family)